MENEKEAVLEIKPKKKSFFFRIIDFFGKKKMEKVEEEDKSQFDYYLDGVGKSDPMYQDIKKTSELCNNAVHVAKQRISFIKKIQELDEKMFELEAYDKITEEELKYLKNLLGNYQSLNRDKTNLMEQITGFDKGLENMERKIDDAKYVLDKLVEAEKSQKILKSDIGLIQGEKAELEYEYEQMTTAQGFIYKASVGLVVVFCCIFLLLSYFFAFRQVSIFLPAAILCLFLIVIVSGIYMFRNKLHAELKLNVLKQIKIRGILNKKNVVHAYYTNFVNFVYKKYNVRGSEKLRKNIVDFSQYKNVTSRFDKLRNTMYQTEKSIEDFLREKKITSAMITVEGFAKTISIEDKKRAYKNYSDEKKRLEARLSELDVLHEKIWKNLVKLNDSDNTEEDIIGKIIESYVDEVGNLTSINLEAIPENEGAEVPVSDIDKLFKKIADLNQSIENEEADKEIARNEEKSNY